MPLKLMYITNSEDVAHIAEEAGVDRIFVDMEYIGKTDRQGGMDTVQSRHTADDVRRLAQCLNKSELFVRVNPIHEKTDKYSSSKEEIDEVIEAGADLLMLPYFKTAEEVQTFVKYVDGRAKTVLLVETPEAAAIAENLVKIPGIDEMFIGLNDLSLGYGKNFMFELLLDGTVEELCLKFQKRRNSLWVRRNCFVRKRNASFGICDQRTLSSWFYMCDFVTEFLQDRSSDRFKRNPEDF